MDFGSEIGKPDACHRVFRTYCEKLLGFKIHRETRFQLFEEVIAFVIHQDECREVNDVDFVNSFHTELRILNALNAADGLSRQVGSNTADGAEIEAAVFLAGFGNDCCTEIGRASCRERV